MPAKSFHRRQTRPVHVGTTIIGGDAPLVIQSMTNTPTLDTDASALQALKIADAGATLVRLTAQGVAHAANLANIAAKINHRVPLSADIHFNPAAALEAARHVEKVRINPGNFADPGRTFRQLEYTDEQYATELEKIDRALSPLLDICAQRGVALRIGVNHGSLSDRIMSRYGDTPEGMVESALEFLRVCKKHDFHNVVVSVKASNVIVMVRTMRLMATAMDAEDLNYPLHLGVTEAGDGEDGRVKSAVGIGTLLAEGIGDTIRVSLAEPPENEIPVARMLIDHVGQMSLNAPIVNPRADAPTPLVVGIDATADQLLEQGYTLITASGSNALAETKAALADCLTPSLLKLSYPADMPAESVAIAAAVDMGSSLIDGLADAVWLDAPSLSNDQANSLVLAILQATRRRITRTEYIACPGCGRTLYDLQSALAEIRNATSHLAGLRIAVMGCIVNGPGEMADADYGYIGAGKGKVSLYKGRQCVIPNIPSDQALPMLINLIRENGDWTDATH